ncbi:MAG: methyltransferase domain-containing protein [Myxococcaceae bacterium]|nr:methyltransferase domain-containing protein [Myxococcaceae bacterium]
MSDATYSGERYDPLSANALAWADHHARYEFVKASFSGGRLLDVGCGLGVGAAALASAFAAVRGVDASAEAVATASRLRSSATVTFSTVSELRRDAPGPFDVVTCLEVIEHTTHQRELLELLAAFLSKEGVAIISTPNRAWTERRGLVNPYHVKELHEAEFFELVEASFPCVQRWRQVQTSGAAVIAEASTKQVSTVLTTARQQHAAVGVDEVTNFVAVCSWQPRPMATPVSVLDASCSWPAELAAVVRATERRVDERDQLIREQDQLVAALKAERASLAELNAQLAARVDRLVNGLELPEASGRPLRWRLADRANDVLKRTPLHHGLKRLLGR